MDLIKYIVDISKDYPFKNRKYDAAIQLKIKGKGVIKTYTLIVNLDKTNHESSKVCIIIKINVLSQSNFKLTTIINEEPDYHRILWKWFKRITRKLSLAFLALDSRAELRLFSIFTISTIKQ
ncbi:hypothetical protein ACTFIZ_002708 [Dictyostelium cf. discoideum]